MNQNKHKIHQAKQQATTSNNKQQQQQTTTKLKRPRSLNQSIVLKILRCRHTHPRTKDLVLNLQLILAKYIHASICAPVSMPSASTNQGKRGRYQAHNTS